MAGIYKIQNSVSGKIYVGSTRKSFAEKWSKHRGLLRKNKHYKNGFSANHRKNISFSKRGKLAYEMTDTIRQKISQNRMGICRGESHVNYKGKYRFIRPIHGEVLAAQCDLVRNYGISECKASLLCSGKRKSHKQWECKGKVE